MTVNLVTHFDKSYLEKGIALYRSCARHLSDFHLYIVVLDEQVQKQLVLSRQLQNATIVPLYSVIGNELTAVRQNRTWQEFCWTLTPVITQYVLEHYKLDSIIYLDADSFLFGDLKPVYDEIENARADIAIVPHRFPPGKDKSQNGIYNVNGVYFRNTDKAYECLNEWQIQCYAWCYNRNEGGKYADQKYLDTWTERYGAHVIQNIGFNLAPWNQSQYFYEYDSRLYVIDADMCIDYGKRMIHRIDSLCLYHFHEFNFGANGNIQRGNYPLHEAIVKYVYLPYEAEMRQIRKEIANG